jgi:hypothetical protein
MTAVKDVQGLQWAMDCNGQDLDLVPSVLSNKTCSVATQTEHHFNPMQYIADSHISLKQSIHSSEAE